MIHPDTELRFVSPEIGHGVFATRRIPKGTITWGLCHLDHVLSPARRLELPPCYAGVISAFAYLTAQGDAVLCWDIGRYVNHSCSPSSLSLNDELDIAVRDILPGEQLTDDYGMLNLPHVLQCRCGAPGCRREVRADDHLRMGAEWEVQVREAFALASRVPQPVLPYLKNASQLLDMLEGRADVPSPLAYCVPPAAGVGPAPA
ncbi:MAG: SET domain-containing protein [Candidatus Tectomicrobia bacterium]|nr:SET domain-containing protein [Candidatus Tectomicrobia bacterium]